MAEDKTIRIGADTSGARQETSRFMEETKGLFGQLTNEAEKRKSSSKEMLKYLEDEIKLIGRRNEVEFREREKQLTERKRGYEEKLRGMEGSEDPRDYFRREQTRSRISTIDSEISSNRSGYNESREQTKILRELLAVTKTEARKAVESDPNKVRQELLRTPHHMRTFAQQYQAELLGIDKPDQQGRRDFGGGAVLGAGNTVLHSRNAVDAGYGVIQQGGTSLMASAGVAAPWIAGVLLAVAGVKKMWDDSQKYNAGIGRSYGLTGYRMETGSMTEFGYSRIEQAEASAALARSRRSGHGLSGSVRDMMLLERGAGIDTGLYSSVDQLALASGSGMGGRGFIDMGVANMRAAGVVKGQDLSPVADYLQIMVNLSKEQLSTLGKVDVGVNSKMISALASMDESLSRSPEALATMVNSVKGGLTGASNPQVRAMQLSVLSKLKPGASLYELEEMREKGASTPGYLEGMMALTKKLSGGDKNIEMYLNKSMVMSGGSFGMGRILTEGKGNYLKTMNEDVPAGSGIPDLEGRAKEAATLQEKLDAIKSDMAINIIDGFASMVEANKENTAATLEVADKLMESNSLMNKINATLIYQNTMGFRN